MVETSSPAAWRRWLAVELRRLREDAGFSQKEVGGAFGWSGARVSYVENGHQKVADRDLEKLLPHYGVPEHLWPQYFAAADRSRERGWWERYDERDLPATLGQYIGLEQGAAEIQAYEPLVVDDLLQTPAYAAALFRADFRPYTSAQVARHVELRVARQSVLRREPDPLRSWVVLEEAVLRRVMGDSDVMAAQLTCLADAAGEPNVTVQVLPFATGASGHGTGAFRVLGFPWASDPGVVYVPNRVGAVYLEQPHEIDAYMLLFQHLCGLALPPDESVAMIRAAAKEHAGG